MKMHENKMLQILKPFIFPMWMQRVGCETVSQCKKSYKEFLPVPKAGEEFKPELVLNAPMHHTMRRLYNELHSYFYQLREVSFMT